MSSNGLPHGVVIGLFVGKARDRWPGRPPSAIGKTAMDGPLRIEADGFVDDEQADLTVHGGPEKAVHHYAAEHMAFWRDTFAEHADRFHPGCFGENVSTTGLTEDTLCLGDVFALGTACVEVCQGRQPCWKLAAHMEIDALPPQFQRTGRTGWYYRVLEPGEVRNGDAVRVVERSLPDWPLARVIAARFDPRLDPADAAALADLAALSESWRVAFAKKARRGFVEDTARRLKG